MTKEIIWRDRSGESIACLEKLRLLNENALELTQTMRDAWDDALLMGVDPDVMHGFLDGLVKELRERPAS